MKEFYFVAINPHFKQGHFQTWRDLCTDAFRHTNFLYIEYENYGQLVEEIKANPRKFQGEHIHLEWIHDLMPQQIENFNELAQEFDFQWSTHMAVSQALRNNQGSSKKTIVELFELLKLMSKLKAVWTWDIEFDNTRFGGFQIYGVPDLQVLELKQNKCLLCSQAEENAKRPKNVGLAGQLYGYRGVDLVVQLAQKYKEINFLLLGKSYPESFDSRTIRFLNKNSQNLTLLDEYFESDVELNHAISHLSCLIIDTSRYPEPSGIAIRALAYGIPILIEDADSYLRYLSKSTLGIHLIKKGFMGSKLVDWEKVTRPINPIVESRQSALLKLQHVKNVTIGEIN